MFKRITCLLQKYNILTAYYIVILLTLIPAYGEKLLIEYIS